MKYNSLAVAGPSTSGKTDAAIALARKFNGALICCDMVQIWKGYEIASGMPAKEQTKGLQMHLYGVLEPGPRLISKFQYHSLAAKARREAMHAKQLPIFEGCSSNYTRVLLGDPYSPDEKQLNPEFPAHEYGEIPMFVLFTELEGLRARLEKRLFKLWGEIVDEVKGLLGNESIKKKQRPAPLKAGIVYNIISRYFCENTELLTRELDSLEKGEIYKAIHEEILTKAEKNIHQQTDFFNNLFQEFSDRQLFRIDASNPEETLEQLEELIN